MASSGFEGFEKRLELDFTIVGANARGLRLLSVDALQEALDAVKCAVVSAAGNGALDAYVLSESSMFVYPTRAILKTCGTTRLLHAVPILLCHAAELGLELRSCRYSRGSFLFPQAQPFPHADFADEVCFLEDAIPGVLPFRESRVLPSKNWRNWHVYSASATATLATDDKSSAPPFTIEVCMTELDSLLARQFHRMPGDDRTNHAIGAEMTAFSGIGDINPRSLVFGYAFVPCGYSMNGLDGAKYSTVHVTPEDGHSYASFECVGGPEAISFIGRAAAAFRPSSLTVSVCATNGDNTSKVWSAVKDAVEPLGLACQSEASDNFPGAGTVTYQTFRTMRGDRDHDK